MKKRHIASIFTLFVSISLASCQPIYEFLGGNFTGEPDKLWELPKDSLPLKLIDDAYKGLEGVGIIDHHAHIVGLNSGVGEYQKMCPDVKFDPSSLYINPKRFSFTDPALYFTTQSLMTALAIDDLSKANEQNAMRMESLIKNVRKDKAAMPGSFHIMAMDGVYKDGPASECVGGKTRLPDFEKTDLMIPNDYAINLSTCLNQQFKGAAPLVAVASIHPRRCDALNELERVRKRGVQFIKWLPNTMDIDPSDERNIPFYRKMKELGMVMIAHTGHEHVLVADKKHQKYGNPWLWKKALDTGLTVIMAHSGYKGATCKAKGEKAEWNAKLFLELIRDKKYRCNLFGELSATTFILYDEPLDIDDPSCAGSPDGDPKEILISHLKTLITDKSLKNRIVNGSDYPLPGVNILSPTKLLFEEGFITADERAALDIIYGYNPFLFDFVVKRTIKNPGGKEKFPTEMFGPLDNQLRRLGCSSLPDPYSEQPFLLKGHRTITN